MVRRSMLASGLTLFGWLLPAIALADSITVANNGGTLGAGYREAYYKPFTAKTGYIVIDDAFNQELPKIRLQVESNHLLWDLVSVTAINEARACEEGLFERIDWSQYLDPNDFAYVGGFGKCGIPNNFVSGGLVYDIDAFKGHNLPKSWVDFWDVKKFPGKRGLLYRAEQTLEVALMADGVPPANAMEVLAAPGGIDRAFKKLAELKPHIKWWKSGDEALANLETGEVVMTFAWNGRVAVANRNNKRNFKIEFGAGHVSGSQMIAIMKGTKKKEIALDFLKLSSSPEPQAAFARFIDYAPANAKAYAFMSADERAAFPTDYMHLASLQGGQLYLSFWIKNGEALQKRFITFASQ